MITVWGGSTSRSLRVTWLLEEMGLGYRIRPVNLLSDAPDADFLAANPAGYIPVLQDDDVTMVESIAIMEYLIARYGPTPLAPAAEDPAFAAYQQFLHLGEAGLATFLMVVIISRFFGPAAERNNWGAQQSVAMFESRFALVTRQLARSPYMAGEAFTAADISVTYALSLAEKADVVQPFDDAVQAYLARTTGRAGYKRALETSEAAVAG
jgi:glutathione S-transferase/3-isopropylmalate dehydratase